MGFSNLVGYTVLLQEQGKCEMQLILEDKHLNGAGRTHGGALMTLLDVAGGLAGQDKSGTQQGFTISLTTNFLAASKTGDTLRAVGIKTGGGKSIWFSKMEIHNQNNVKIADAIGTYKYIHSFSKPTLVP